jgi:endo-1,4-beta-xylanase
MSDTRKTRRKFLLSTGLAAGGAVLLRPSLAAGETSQEIGGSASLKAHAARSNRLFGFAVNTAVLRTNPAYRALLRQQCSILVAENAMKWKPLRPTADTFHFDEPDSLVDFATSSGIMVRGHNLCWHESLPDWFASTTTKANARDLLTTHIRTVAGRYKGRIHSWDVVNEAIDPHDGLPGGMRNSPWLQLAGPDYVDIAFRTAREADPSALLTYNDYGFEEESPAAEAKRAAILQLLRGMRQRKVPLDAVGIQSHLKAGHTYGPGLRQFLDACNQLDLQIFITEMDVDDRELPADTAMRDAAVAKIYRTYLELVLAAPRVGAVLVWGVDNGHTWLNSGMRKRPDGLPQRALLFDEKLQPTPAFFETGEAVETRN